MKRRFTLIIAVLLMAIASFALSACEPQEVTPESEFGKSEYSYTNPTKSSESENGILYDGVLDEEIYKNEAYWYEGYFGEDNRRAVYPKDEYEMSLAEGKLFVYLSDTGIHVASKVKDDVIFTGMYASDGRLIFDVSMTGINMFITNPYEGNTKSMEWRVTADGASSLLRNRDGYSGRLGWTIYGSKIGTTVNAPNGRTNAEGYVIEAFMPYENTIFKSKPESIGVVFGLNRVSKADAESGNIRRVFEVSDEINGVSTATPSSWLPVDANGWVKTVKYTPDAEVFGNEQYWNEYDGNTLKAVSYDTKIYDTRNVTNSTDFNSYVAGVNYDPNFNETKEKGMTVKAVLLEDGFYFDVTAKHNLIRQGSDDWGQNNNIELNFTSHVGASRTAFIAHKSTNSDGSVEVMCSNILTAKITTKPAPSGVNYKYVSNYYGFIPKRLLNSMGFIHNAEENPAVRFAVAFRSGGNNTVKEVAIPLSSLVGGDGAVSDITLDTSLVGKYYGVEKSGSAYTKIPETEYSITKNADGYTLNNAKVTLRRVQYATVNIEGAPYVLYYLDFPEENDSIYSLGAHTTAKPYIWYPMGSSPYEMNTRKFVTDKGIEYSYNATEAVIDGNADDAIWTGYKGYTASAQEVFASAPTEQNNAKEGRGFKVKAIRGSDGVYLYGEIVHSELNYTMPYAHWISNLDIQFGITPKGSEWDEKSDAEIVPIDAKYGSRPYTVVGSFNITPIGSGYSGIEYIMTSSKVGEYNLTKIEGFVSYANMNVIEDTSIVITPETFNDYDLRIGIKWRTLSEFMRVRSGDTEDKNVNQWHDVSTALDAKTTVVDGNGTRSFNGINRLFYLTENGLLATPNATTFTVDGKDGDWANHDGYTQTVTDEASSGKSVTYKAKLTDEGLYYIASAKTATFYKHHGFSKGTALIVKTLVSGNQSSIAMMSGAGVVNAYGAGGTGIVKGFMGATDASYDSDKGLYTVTMEGFIPRYWLVKSKVTGVSTGTMKVAFDFSPANSASLDSFTQGGNETVWWKSELQSL